jgi:acetolactate synthase-1/2/3 large subunit
VDCAVQESRIAEGLRIPEAKHLAPAPAIAGNPDALAKAAEHLIAAEFPLIVGGRFGIDPAATAPLVELVELVGAAYRDDLAMVAFPTKHPQNLGGDRALLKDADTIVAIDCRDVSSLLDGYTGEKKEVGIGREKAGRKVIDMSLNDVSLSSWSQLKGPQPLIDVQLTCDPLLGMRQLADVVKKRLADDPKSRPDRTAQGVTFEAA